MDIKLTLPGVLVDQFLCPHGGIGFFVIMPEIQDHLDAGSCASCGDLAAVIFQSVLAHVSGFVPQGSVKVFRPERWVGDGPKVAVKVGLGSGVGVSDGIGVAEGVGVALRRSVCSVEINAAMIISTDAVFSASVRGCGNEQPAYNRQVRKIPMISRNEPDLMNTFGGVES